MASLQSYAESPVVVTLDDESGEISITGGVLEVDGALDAIPDLYHTIRCSSSGGLRFLAGASGTFGGRKQTLNVIEEPTAHTFGNDNGKHVAATQDNPGNPGGANARFGPGLTQALVIDNVRWFIEARTSRVDFDFAQGATADGVSGAANTIRGLHLIQTYDSTRNAQQFNHIWSRNVKLEVHPELGFGFRISNYTLCHAVLLETQPNAQFAGLKTDDVDYAGNDGGRVVVNPGANETWTLNDLDAPDITEAGSPASAKTILVNPKGAPPTRTNNWSGYTSQFEVQRDIPFDFTGATDATGTLHAIHTNTHSEAADAQVAIPASGDVKVRVKTNYSAAGAANGAWSSLDGFRFAAYGRGFKKYWSGSTAISAGDAPATRQVALTNQVFPDGTAIAAYPGSDAIDTAAEFMRVIKDYEQAHPDLPSRAESMVEIDSSGDIVLGPSMAVVLSTTATDLIDDSSNVLTLKTAASGIEASNGINAIDFGSTTILQSGTKALLKLPIIDSSGESSMVLVTGMSEHFTGVYKADGTPLGSHTFERNGFAPAILVSAADSLANTKVIYAKPGQVCTTRTIDLSDGGRFTLNFGDLQTEVDQDGNALYDPNATLAGLEAVFDSSTHQCTLEIPNDAADVRQLYKAFQDGLATEAGGAFCALGHVPLKIAEFEGQGANLTLGPDIQLRRAASSGNNAAVAAIPTGGIGGQIVNTDRGEVLFLPKAVIDTTTLVAKLDANASMLETIIRQLAHVATSLPLSFPEGSPLSPLCAVQGLEGQEVIRDVESRAYAVTPTGVDIAVDASGVHSFSGSNSHIDYTLTRLLGGVETQFTKEIITLFQVRPTAFHATEAYPLFSIGALVVSIAPSSGSTAAVRVGATGTNDTTAELTLNAWNTIVFSVEQVDGRASYPKMRISVNGAAQEAWNLESNENFAQIASGTSNFRLGARSSGNTSFGFVGDMRAMIMHPNNAVFGNGAGWTIPAGIAWDRYLQIYTGASLMDRVEGVLKDVYEPIIDEIAAKSHTLQDMAVAVMTQPSTPGQTASDATTASLIARQKWLAANANTTTPASKEDIAAAVKDAVLEHLIETDVSVEALWRAVGSVLGGKSARTGSVTDFKAMGGGDDVRLRLITGDEDGVRTASVIDPDP